jgi:hypothetical protein
MEAGFKLEAASFEAGSTATGDVVFFQQQRFQPCFGSIGSGSQATVTGTHNNYIELLLHDCPPFPGITSKFILIV